jgi:hypothetical protein
MGARASVWRAGAIGAFVLAVAGSATAQAPSTTGGGASADAQVGFQRQPQLSPQEELRESDGILIRMDQASASVRHQLERARTARDVVKSLCLNDKLSQIDVAGRTGKDRQTALQAAVQRGDAELANHEFTILTVLRQRAEQLTAEANQCLGEEVAFVGQTEVTEEVNPNLPTEDMTEYPPTAPVLVGPVTPPPQVSGTH